MKNLIYIFQIFVAVFLIFLILIQQPRKGGIIFKRRGVEKIVFYLTCFFAILFVVLSLLILKIK